MIKRSAQHKMAELASLRTHSPDLGSNLAQAALTDIVDDSHAFFDVRAGLGAWLLSSVPFAAVGLWAADYGASSAVCRTCAAPLWSPCSISATAASRFSAWPTPRSVTRRRATLARCSWLPCWPQHLTPSHVWSVHRALLQRQPQPAAATRSAWRCCCPWRSS